MLKGLDPVLSADLLWVLAAMGHGDDLALVDANHPAQTIAAGTTSGRLIRLPGLSMARAARAILSVLPLDDFEPGPVRRMEVVGNPDEIPAVQAEMQAEIDFAAGRSTPCLGIERFAFYEAAKASFAVIQVGDPRPYGCFLLRKGVIAGEPG
ncbi:RbsD/FucU family protein [Bosea sp. (in: a-proteobacteria)]|jgi:L-fucose mutarotase|uniref:RbsD/FucU family protein n=1 Tax=Bosea sp. (in: a-proteobacteria) TaxID=1871050 RepID=UPI003F715EE4